MAHPKVVKKGDAAYDVYIGRGSKWGNPFIIGVHGNRIEVINQYETWVRTQPDLLKDLGELKDKTLGCFCSPLKCHGEILIKLLEELETNQKQLPT